MSTSGPSHPNVILTSEVTCKISVTTGYKDETSTLLTMFYHDLLQTQQHGWWANSHGHLYMLTPHSTNAQFLNYCINIFNKLIIPFLASLYFITGNKQVYEITMLSACVCSITVNQITDFHKIWYKILCHWSSPCQTFQIPAISNRNMADLRTCKVRVMLNWRPEVKCGKRTSRTTQLL